MSEKSKGGTRSTDVGERLRARLAELGPLDPAACWPWPGRRTGGGYGQIRNCYRSVYTHRVSYEIAKGPIPEGMVIDHLCRNPPCCNPAHLEAVPQRVNVVRGDAGHALLGYRRATCRKSEHPMTPENTMGKTAPRCRACYREWLAGHPKRRAA